MIITFKKDADPNIVNSIKQMLSEKQLHGFSFGRNLAIVHQKSIELSEEQRNSIENINSKDPSYLAISRMFHDSSVVFKLPHSVIGGDKFTIISNSNVIYSNGQIHRDAIMAHQGDATIISGNAFSQQMNAYDDKNMNLGEKGLQYLRSAADANELDVMSEIDCSDHVNIFSKYVDIIKIGSRNMRNYELIKKVALTGKVVALTRAADSSIDEWLNVAEYIAELGNMQIIFVEEGIRTFENHYVRFTLPLETFPILKKLTYYPVFISPSISSNNYKLVSSLTKGALISGANGAIVSVGDETNDHSSITSQEFLEMEQQIKSLISSVSLWKN